MNAPASSACPSTTTFSRPYGAQANTSLIVLLSARNCLNIGYENVVRMRWPSGPLATTPYSLELVTMSLRPAHRRRTSESGSFTGTLVSSIALTALKMAALAPIPSPSDRTTTAVHPLLLSSMRAAWRRSLSMFAYHPGKMLMRFLVALVVTVPLLDGGMAERLAGLTRTSLWIEAGSIPVAFGAFHPQGMVKIGDTFFVSSVDKGTQVGHLFKIDNSGKLLADLKLVEGAMYHPGGIDYDGPDIWVPLAEYRPDSRSIVYRVNPDTMKATEVLRVADHLGAVVHDTDDDSVHAVSWGSRRFYKWTRGGAGPMTQTLNPSYYVDYQDCKYIRGHRMVCSGVADLRGAPGLPAFRLGGLELIDLADGSPIHQVPIALVTPSGVGMTQNPLWLEPHGTGLRAYFMPEDNHSTIYIYDVDTAR